MGGPLAEVAGALLPPAAHGALEYGIPGPPAPGIPVACAQGAAVPALPAGGGTGLVVPPLAAAALGWLAMCTDCIGWAASGSVSHENRDPKGKC